MCEIPGEPLLEQSKYTLKSERQEGKTSPVQGWVPVGEGDKQRGWRGSKYGPGTLYMCVKVEQWYLLQLFWDRGQ
jgi:hypothetical protein